MLSSPPAARVWPSAVNATINEPLSYQPSIIHRGLRTLPVELTATAA